MKITTFSPIQPSQSLYSTPVAFSGLSSSWAVRTTDAALSTLQKNRTREMLFEDVMGFGVLRTGMDLFRQYFFKPEGGTASRRQLNIPAARERMIRELGSIFTDNFMGGILAYGLGWGASKLKGNAPNLANRFLSVETLELFRQVAGKSPSQSAFIRNLAQAVAPGKAAVVSPMLRAGLLGNTPAVDVALNVVKASRPSAASLDVMINKRAFPLDTLISDAASFLKLTGKSAHWQQQAQKLLKDTIRLNSWRLPVCLGLAMAMTMAVPYLNRNLTRKLDGVDRYPGELGLRSAQSAAVNTEGSWTDRWFPYLAQKLKAGNPIPALLSLIPLPFAFGLFDTVKLSAGNWRGAFNNPLKKGFVNRLVSMMQFGKGFPFTTQQQMASCFAFLIFSRLTTARSDIEFRERMVDSFLGWSIWILATPWIKRAIAKRWDPNLLKKVGGELVLKRRVEIERMLPKGLAQNTLGRFIVMSAASLGITIALLGIIEPYIAIKWTEKQARKNPA